MLMKGNPGRYKLGIPVAQEAHHLPPSCMRRRSGKRPADDYSLGVRYTLRGLPRRFIGGASVASVALAVAAIANADSDPSIAVTSAMNAWGESNS